MVSVRHLRRIHRVECVSCLSSSLLTSAVAPRTSVEWDETPALWSPNEIYPPLLLPLWFLPPPCAWFCSLNLLDSPPEVELLRGTCSNWNRKLTVTINKNKIEFRVEKSDLCIGMRVGGSCITLIT